MTTIPADHVGTVRPRSVSRRGAHAGRPTGPRILVKCALLIVAALLAVVTGALPQQLGGKMSYVVTSGISMLPDFHAGDLVILRQEPSYHVGEVAAYHNQQLHVIVLHRIVAIHGDHYVFKGDNNTWATTYEPTKSEIVGAAWLHLPGAGRYVLDIHIPIVAALVLAALWLYSFWGSPSTRRQRRRRHRAH